MADDHQGQGSLNKNSANYGTQTAMTQQQAQLSDAIANSMVISDGHGGLMMNPDYGNNTDWWSKFMNTVIPIGASIGVGAAFAPAAIAAVGAGSSALASGAIQGGIQGAAQAGATGQNVGKGALVGALGGGATKGLTPVVQNATGLGNTAASGLTGAGVGAVKGAVTGQGAGLGAATGLVSGLAQSNAGKALSGQIFGSGAAGNAATGATLGGINAAISGKNPLAGAVSAGAGSAIGAGIGAIGGAVSNNPPQPTNTTSTGTPAMANGDDDLSNIDTSWATNYYQPDPGAFVNPTDDQSVFGQQPTGGYLDPSQFQGADGQSTSGLGQLGKYLAGAAGNGAGGQLLNLAGALAGPAAQYAGSSAQAAAARNAANQYANNTKFNPYSVNTTGGSASFDGTKATSALSAGNQGLYNGLLGLGNNSLNSYNQQNQSVGGYRGINQPLYNASQSANSAGAALPQSNANSSTYNGLLNTYAGNAQKFAGQAQLPTEQSFNTQYANRFNQLQNLDQQANNRFMSGNLDSQFANGILASTAGSYQTQGALDSLNKQTQQNQMTAQDFATQDQGRQLNNFNAGTGAALQYGQGYLGLGQNQYSQNANNNQLQYNRASDAFGRAMNLFQGGNQQANQNQQVALQGVGQAQSGVNSFNDYSQGLLGMGGNLGAAASTANSRAFFPQLNANGVSVNGNFLSGIGNQLSQPTTGNG